MKVVNMLELSPNVNSLDIDKKTLAEILTVFFGWQREVSMKVEEHFKDSRLLPTMTEPEHEEAFQQPAPFTCRLQLPLPHSLCRHAPADVAVHSTFLANPNFPGIVGGERKMSSGW